MECVQLTGRPKKSRNKQPDEVNKQGNKERLKRWVDIKCGWYREVGHTQKTCSKKAGGEDKVKVHFMFLFS